MSHNWIRCNFLSHVLESCFVSPCIHDVTWSSSTNLRASSTPKQWRKSIWTWIRKHFLSYITFHFRNFWSCIIFSLLFLHDQSGNFIASDQNVHLDISDALSFAGRDTWSPYCSHLEAHKIDSRPPCLGIINSHFHESYGTRIDLIRNTDTYTLFKQYSSSDILTLPLNTVLSKLNLKGRDAEWWGIKLNHKWPSQCRCCWYWRVSGCAVWPLSSSRVASKRK
jgi:hypothetical protein